MTVQLNLPFETLVELIEQLPEQQRQDLLRRLQQPKSSNGQTLDKMKLLRAAQTDAATHQEPPLRREDWYNDDGR